MTTLAAAVPARRSESRFYGAMAAFVLVAVFAGFGPTYYLRPVFRPGQPLSRILHVHGFVFSVWVALFLTQVTLVSARRVDLHRKLGLLGAAWAALMVPVGAAAALHVAAAATGDLAVELRRFLAVQVFDLGVFAALVAAGIVLRRDTQSHKRLMLLAMVSLLPPAVARWPFPPSLPGGIVTIFLLSYLAVLPLAWFDLRTRGSLHRATLWGGLLILLGIPARFLLAASDGWLRFADWLMARVG
ncbi:MAG TPA: hypothetical protein VFQ51_18330 [Vicinamibacteria bacterium]|nr:hypothetical protein [Vicinamibacteria bacterium]